jgi:uncharacterized protein
MKAYRITKELSNEIHKIGNNKKINDLDEKLLTALYKMRMYPKIESQQQEHLPAKLKPVSHISLNVAQDCDMNCIYCYGGKGEYKDRGLMKSTTAFCAVDWLIEQSRDKKDLAITFFGGEPLLNFKLIRKVVDYAKEKCKKHNKEIHFSMTTNGTLLTKEVIDYINENNFSIVISYDGNIDVQKLNRPLKSISMNHEELEKRVKEFLATRKNRRNTSCRITVTKYNCNLKEVSEYLLNLGFYKIHWTEAIPPIDNDLNNCTYQLTDKHQKSLLLYIEDLEKETFNRIKNDKPLSDRYIMAYIQRLYKKSKKNYFCGVGRGLVGISKDGNIYPCHRFVGHDKLKIGLVNGKMDEKLKITFNNYGNTNIYCVKCWARYFCGGGCLYENMSGVYTDRPIPYENRCKILKRSVEMAISVYDSLNNEDRKKIGIIDKEND